VRDVRSDRRVGLVAERVTVAQAGSVGTSGRPSGQGRSLTGVTVDALLPPPWHGEAASVGLAWSARVDYRDRFRGALLGGAIGDALGRPAEGLDRAEVAARFGVLREFVPWEGWTGGPKGTFTDDTQMTLCVAESLLATGGRLDPGDLARRFVEWLPNGRGVGSTCREAVGALARGVAWDQAGVASAGNGAAMRVGPVGLRHLGDPDALRRDAALSAVVTHADPTAVASAVAQAFMVAWCAHRPAGGLQPAALLGDLGLFLADVAHPPLEPRRADRPPARLADLLAEVASWLGAEPEAVFDHFYNGAFVNESLPSALWCFLNAPEDPEAVIVTAVNGGRDADTVGAMAGTLVGAYCGESGLPGRWLDDLEDADRLRALADALCAAALAEAGRR
jgi:ADP-ribosylglycohydrolase